MNSTSDADSPSLLSTSIGIVVSAKVPPGEWLFRSIRVPDNVKEFHVTFTKTDAKSSSAPLLAIRKHNPPGYSDTGQDDSSIIDLDAWISFRAAQEIQLSDRSSPEPLAGVWFLGIYNVLSVQSSPVFLEGTLSLQGYTAYQSSASKEQCERRGEWQADASLCRCRPHWAGCNCQYAVGLSGPSVWAGQQKDSSSSSIEEVKIVGLLSSETVVDGRLDLGQGELGFIEVDTSAMSAQPSATNCILSVTALDPSALVQTELVALSPGHNLSTELRLWDVRNISAVPGPKQKLEWLRRDEKAQFGLFSSSGGQIGLKTLCVSSTLAAESILEGSSALTQPPESSQQAEKSSHWHIIVLVASLVSLTIGLVVLHVRKRREGRRPLDPQQHSRHHYRPSRRSITNTIMSSSSMSSSSSSSSPQPLKGVNSSVSAKEYEAGGRLSSPSRRSLVSPGSSNESSDEGEDDLQLTARSTRADFELRSSTANTFLSVGSEEGRASAKMSHGATGSEYLPDCWCLAVDPKSGRIYYYNSLTTETRWELPTEAENII